VRRAMRSAGGRSDIRTVEGLLGHCDLRTTMIYTHVVRRAPWGVGSPADTLSRDLAALDAGFRVEFLMARHQCDVEGRVAAPVGLALCRDCLEIAG
jgi:hypothetical protein